MDPVNPAPAGNPQLTTHLLVSHKKNKNFHPSKVSLKRVKVIRKQMQILNPAVPVENYLNPKFITKRVRCGRTLQLTDVTLKQLSKGGLFSTRLEYTPWNSYLRLQYDGILSQTDETGRKVESFINPTFALKLFNYDGTELLTVSEKEVSLQRLQENFRDGFFFFKFQRLTGPTLIESEYSWDGLQLKFGDSEMHKAMDTQPMRSLGNSSAFFDKHYFFSRRSDEKVRNILREIVRRKSLDHSESLYSLQDETTRLSHYLKYLCDRARAVSPVSAEMVSLIRQMVERLVYYIEPMIVAIVEPVVDHPSQFNNSVLAIKMRDTFQKLCEFKRQTAEPLKEFLATLESWLF